MSIVLWGRFELPKSCLYYALNVARLPVSPPQHFIEYRRFEEDSKIFEAFLCFKNIPTFSRMLECFYFVGEGRLELPCLAASAPKAGVSAISPLAQF